MENFGKICFSIVAMFLLAIWSGFVFSRLWEWFISTTFQAKELSIVQAIGVCLVVGYAAKQRDKKKEKKSFEETAWELLESGFVSLVVLGMGWIVKLFMQ